MYKCLCGRVFNKRANYYKHSTVHKNNSNVDYIEDEESMEIYSEKDNYDDLSQESDDNLSQDNDNLSGDNYVSQDNNDISESNLGEVSDISEHCSFKEDTILIQQYDLLHEKNNQIPYNLISEECYDFAQLVSFE